MSEYVLGVTCGTSLNFTKLPQLPDIIYRNMYPIEHHIAGSSRGIQCHWFHHHHYSTVCFVLQNQSQIFNRNCDSLGAEYCGTPCCQMTNSIYHLVSPRGSVGSNIYRSGCSADIDIDNQGLRVCWIEFKLFISMYIRKNQAHLVKITEITVTSWMKCILIELRG